MSGYSNFGSPYGNQYGNQNQGGGFGLRTLIAIGIAVFGVISYMMHTSVNPVTGEVQHINMSPQQEIALGMQSAPEMAQQMGGEVPDSDPETQFVQQVGAEIVATPEVSRSEYAKSGAFHYHLLADPQTVNAFALPGGQIFITRGLLDKLSDEAEVAGVLGHETGHVIERHSAQKIEQQNLGNELVTAVAVGSRNGQAGMAAIANQLSQLHFSRGDESQADQKGLEYMTAAGFDPRGMEDVMKILQKVAGSGGRSEFLSDHPDPGNRIEAIDAWMAAHPEAALKRGRAVPHDAPARMF